MKQSLMKSKHNQHLKNKEEARQEKENDKNRALKDSVFKAVSFD